MANVDAVLKTLMVLPNSLDASTVKEYILKATHSHAPEGAWLVGTTDAFVEHPIAWGELQETLILNGMIEPGVGADEETEALILEALAEVYNLE